MFADFARRVAAAGQVSLGKEYYEKSRALYERLLTQDPENNAVAAGLARLLLDHPDIENPGRWTVLEPSDMKSQGGATLTRQADGSILVSGKNPDRDVYSLVFRAAPSRMSAIRLEALPDPSFSFFGPGRSAEGGEFQLSELQVISGGKPCTLTGIAVSHDAYDEFSSAIDGKIDDRIGWDPAGRAGVESIAVVTARLECPPVNELKIDMYFSRSQLTQCNLGRFRLSAASDPVIIDQEKKRFAVMRLTDPWASLAPAIGWPAISRLSREWSRVTHQRPLAAVTSMPRSVIGTGRSPTIAEWRAITRPTVSSRRNSPRPTRLRAARARRSLCWWQRHRQIPPTRHSGSSSPFCRRGSDNSPTSRRPGSAFSNSPRAPTMALFAHRAARACSIGPSRATRLSSTVRLALGRRGASLHKTAWTLLAQAMAEYRSGHDAAANQSFRDAADAGTNTPHVMGISAFYRAMILFRQGKKEQGSKLATEAAASMKPLPEDENNPLADGATPDDLVLWLTYKEAKARVQFDSGPAATKQPD